MKLSGVIAERLFKGRWPPGAFLGAINDLAGAMSLTERSSNVPFRLDWSVRAAGHLVRNQWFAIERVALELQRDKTLSESRVARLVHTARRSRPLHLPWTPRTYKRLLDFLLGDDLKLMAGVLGRAVTAPRDG